MDEDLTSVNAEQVSDEVSQLVNEQGSSEEVNSQANEKPKQSREDNAAFKEMRLKAETAEAAAKKADAIIAKQYGHLGINTVAELETALEKQKYEEAGIDPEVVNDIISKHPAIQKANQLIGQQHLQKEISELKSEYPELNINGLEDLDKLPNVDKIYDRHVNKGLSLVEAYRAVNGGQKVDVAKIKEEGIKEYFEKLKTNRKPVEGGGAAPVVVTEKPKTFEDARKGALEMLRQMNQK